MRKQWIQGALFPLLCTWVRGTSEFVLGLIYVIMHLGGGWGQVCMYVCMLKCGTFWKSILAHFGNQFWHILTIN